MTRDIDWGVPIPLPEYDGRPDKRIYVWFDAVIGYLSAGIEWARANGTPDACGSGGRRLIARDRERAATVLYVALRSIDNLKTLFTPYLPFSSQALHEMLGYAGVIAELPEIEERGGGDPHLVLRTDHRGAVGSWTPSALPAGQPLRPPRALFRKLGDEIVAGEVARMEHEASASTS